MWSTWLEKGPIEKILGKNPKNDVFDEKRIKHVRSGRPFIGYERTKTPI